MSQLDVINAKKALATRLRLWGIADADVAKHAGGFIDDLVAQGWMVPADKQAGRWEPPRPHEECGKHPGQYRLACGGCAADRRAVRERAEAEQAERTTTTREEALARMRRDVEAARERTIGTEETR